MRTSSDGPTYAEPWQEHADSGWAIKTLEQLPDRFMAFLQRHTYPELMKPVRA